MPARKAKKVEDAPITPLKLPRGVKTLVVYGGSFDPPHSYHLSVWFPIWVTHGDNTRLVYVPAARSPHKQAGPVASDTHRVRMLMAGLRLRARNAAPAAQGVWTDEIDRARWRLQHDLAESPSYTIDTIRRLRRITPKSVTLRLLIGSDQVLAFHKWRDWRSLLREAEPIVALRAPARTPRELIDQLDAKVWSLQDKLDWASRILPHRPLPKSSTRIRELLPLQPLDTADFWSELTCVTPEVKKYIVQHRLYGVGTKYKPTRVPPRSARGERAKARKK